MKSTVHKAMHCQSLSFPSSQAGCPLQRWFLSALLLASRLCHFLIPGRCHVSSHPLLMYPNASDSNKGRAVAPFEVCERILLFQACLGPAGGHSPSNIPAAFIALVRVTGCLAASSNMEYEFLSLYFRLCFWWGCGFPGLSEERAES